ncbi:hypothetical protein QYE76_032208 [Lolium multiflorum]|uniref:Uncharacterized protein n=1 Tax=Lolium multiflorum TaxID=4521 RepID=A0AAD8QT21_LOLMU|nr:hypothetical protein QYE76_032208 [Lolium multiflorum]
MCASKDNLFADALDKQIRVLIKIPRDLRIHVCNIDIHTNGSGIALEALEEKDLGTLTRVPHAGNTDPEAASDAEDPEAPAPTKRKRGASSGPASKRAREAPSAAATRKAEAEKKRFKQIDTSKQSQPTIDQFFLSSSKNSGSKPPKSPKKKAKPSPATMPITPEVEVPPKASSSAAPNPKDVINLDDLPEESNAESGKADPARANPARAQEIANRPSIKEISAELEVLKAEHESLQKFLKESSEKETKMKKELEEKHAQDVSDLADKLKKSHQRVKTLAAKNKAYETEAENIDKMIFPSSSRGVASLTLAMCTAHFPAMNFARVACGVPKGTNIKVALTESQGYDRLFAGRVNHLFWYNKYDLPKGFSDAEDEEEDEDVEEGSESSANRSNEGSDNDSGDGSAYEASEEEDHTYE